MNYIHCIDKTACKYIAHIDTSSGQIGAVIRDGKMEENVLIYRYSVLVGGSYAALVVFTNIADDSFLDCRMTPLVVEFKEDMEIAEHISCHFIKTNFIH